MKGYPNSVRVPARDSFSYTAGQHLHKLGPMRERDLFSAITSLMRGPARDEALQRAVRGGWLAVTDGGRIDCTAAARAHYDRLEGKVAIKRMGEIAAPRQVPSVFDRAPLSRKYFPNPNGTRADVPTWSVRPEGFGFKNIGGGKV